MSRPSSREEREPDGVIACARNGALSGGSGSLGVGEGRGIEQVIRPLEATP